MENEAKNNWCFTSWNEIKFNKYNLCEFMIYQKEKCKTGRLHYQGYIEFKKPYKLNQVKSLFKETAICFSDARESKERNILYCSKLDTYAGLRVTYSETNLITQEEIVEDWDDFNNMFDI